MFLVVVVAVAALILIGFSWYFLARDRRLERPDSPPLEAADRESTAAVSAAETVGAAPAFRDRLGTARSALGAYLGSVFGRGAISEQTWSNLEEALIRADVGVGAAAGIISVVRAKAADEGLDDTSELADLVKGEIVSRLTGFDRSLSVDLADARGEPGPAVWLFVGVNGVGKTTTIGKLAQRQSVAGRSVVLAAGDTFRAAAVEQLAVWSERSNVEIVRGSKGADPSSVVFDAIEHAAARSVRLVMADTAGRLQTRTNLMEELRKVRRVAEKGSGTVTETLLVIDATTGQNGLSQARQFTEAVDVTGVVLTKLDGSAKGGIVVAIHSELGIPVKLAGLGEGIDDLVDFDPVEFVDALFE